MSADAQQNMANVCAQRRLTEAETCDNKGGPEGASTPVVPALDQHHLDERKC